MLYALCGERREPIGDTMKDVAVIREILDKTYPKAKISLNFSNPLELLVATVLSAQCTDERVNKVTKSLFKKYQTAAGQSQPNKLRSGENHPGCLQR